MGDNGSQGIRISLPPETVVKGENGRYTVKRFICMSTRSTTVLCEDVQGNTYRLKLYNGQHNITNLLQKKVREVNTKGVITPIDLGEYGGCPFAIFPNVDATDASRYPISQSILVEKIIPQLTFVLYKFHQNRVLLRDISPENVIYMERKQQIAYCGFNNMTVLPDKATITKADGYGQHPSFIAPEVANYGYSIYSDYYALGVTILCMVLGRNPMQSMSSEDIYTCLQNGRIPGINMDHLRNTSYEFYSEEDRILYLVLGLMLPNPRDRWGIGEIRCWCNKQQIPLIRKNGRIAYQYNEPFLAGGENCWNYRQLSQEIAADRNSWGDATYARLEQFAMRQKIAAWSQVSTNCKQIGMTANGRIFRAIYGINPALDGFWWVGKKYADTNELVRKAATDKLVAMMLSEILKTHSISYFLRMRKQVTTVSDAEIAELEQIEQWEIQEPGKGVNRCLMKFARNMQTRSFWIGGREYKNLDQFIMCYANAGLQLKKISADILNNDNFQAWLWANGLEAAGIAAQNIGTAHAEQCFYMLLSIAESAAASESAKQTARRIYLKYGEYAPIYWLTERISDYKMVSIGDQILYDIFKDAKLSLTNPLNVLSSNISRLIPDYQHFVARTASSLAVVKSADLEFCDFSYYPVGNDEYFSYKWDNGLEVTLSFLKSIGLKS